MPSPESKRDPCRVAVGCLEHTPALGYRRNHTSVRCSDLYSTDDYWKGYLTLASTAAQRVNQLQLVTNALVASDRVE